MSRLWMCSLNDVPESLRWMKIWRDACSISSRYSRVGLLMLVNLDQRVVVMATW